MIYTYVVLDDRDYYGPHFDRLFFSETLMKYHIERTYKHKCEYKIMVFNCDQEGSAIMREGSLLS